MMKHVARAAFSSAFSCSASRVGSRAAFCALPEGGFARAQPSTSGLSGAFSSITEEELFLFDLEGYLVVKNVFSKEEIAAANAAVDKRKDEMVERHGPLRNSKDGTFLAGDGKTGRSDLAGMLGAVTLWRRVLLGLNE